MTQYTKVIDGHGHCFEFVLLLVSKKLVSWLVDWMDWMMTRVWVEERRQ